MSKGSKRRPSFIDETEYQQRWEKTFGALRERHDITLRVRPRQGEGELTETEAHQEPCHDASGSLT